MYKEKIFHYLKNTAYIILLLMILISIGGTIYVGEFVNKNVLSIKSINQLELTQNPNSEIYADDGKTLIWTDAEYLHYPSTKESQNQSSYLSSLYRCLLVLKGHLPYIFQKSS